MGSNNAQYILDSIREKIRRDLDTVYEEEKTRLVKRLDEEKEQVIATTAIKLAEYYSVEDMGRTIKIVVEKRGNHGE